MKVSELVRKLILPLGIVFLFFIVTTALGPTFEGRGGYVDNISELLDMRKERNLATWFASMVFLACALSFLPLASAGGDRRGFPRHARAFFLLCAAGCLFLSADEAGEIHEKLGVLFERATGVMRGTEIDDLGFSWLLIYAPVGLLGLTLIVFNHRRLIRAMPEGTRERRRAWVLLGLFAACVPAALGFEALQASAFGRQSLVNVLTCIEEPLEVAAALSLCTCNSILSTEHGL